MTKKLFIIVIFFISTFPFRLVAQFSITVIRPNDIALKSKDLWNCILQNSNNNSQEVFIHGLVTEIKKGKLLEIQSGNFELKPGITQFNTRNYDVLRNEKVLYSDQIFEDHIIRTNTIPNGNYKICISLFDQKTEFKLAEQCLDFAIFRASPPALISPSDKDSICDLNPFFIWSPVPEFSQSNNKIQYSLELFEVLKNQTPIAAVQKNPAFFTEKNIEDPIYQYPIYAIPFLENTQYAWHVVVMEQEKKIAISEVRSFWWKKCEDNQRLDEEEEKEKSRNKNSRKPGLRYAHPSKTEQVFPISVYANRLNAILISSRINDQVYYRVYDLNRKVIVRDKLELQKGANYFEFDLTKWNVIPENIYTLCFTNTQGVDSYIKFRLPKIEKK